MEIYENADKQVAARENGHFKENGCDQVEKQRLLSVPRYEGLIGQISRQQTVTRPTCRFMSVSSSNWFGLWSKKNVCKHCHRDTNELLICFLACHRLNTNGRSDLPCKSKSCRSFATRQVRVPQPWFLHEGSGLFC